MSPLPPEAMIRYQLLTAIFGGTGAFGLLMADALYALNDLQALDGGTEVPLAWVVPLGALLSGIAGVLLFGRIVGRWEERQTQRDQKLAHIARHAERIARLEGQVGLPPTTQDEEG